MSSSTDNPNNINTKPSTNVDNTKTLMGPPPIPPLKPRYRIKPATPNPNEPKKLTTTITRVIDPSEIQSTSKFVNPIHRFYYPSKLPQPQLPKPPQHLPKPPQQLPKPPQQPPKPGHHLVKPGHHLAKPGHHLPKPPHHLPKPPPKFIAKDKPIDAKPSIPKTNFICSSFIKLIQSEENKALENLKKKRINIGPGYQAEIPELQQSRPSSSTNDVKHSEKTVNVVNDSENQGEDNDDDDDESDLLLWRPQPSIRDDDLQDYIDLAQDVLDFSEDVALGILTYHDFDLKQCIEHMNFVKVFFQNNDTDIEDANLERFIFTEHKLDMIKGIIGGNKADINKLFLRYYTRQNSPPSYSEILMIQHEDEMPIFNKIRDEADDKETKDDELDLSTIIQLCCSNNKNKNSIFDVTKLGYFKRKRQHLNQLKKNTQRIRQHNQNLLNKLKPSMIDYSRFIHFLRTCKASPLWNIYEVILFTALLETIKGRIDFPIFSSFIETKTAEQCRQFYSDHIIFLKKVLEFKNPAHRIIMLQRYMGITPRK